MNTRIEQLQLRHTGLAAIFAAALLGATLIAAEPEPAPIPADPHADHTATTPETAKIDPAMAEQFAQLQVKMAQLEAAHAKNAPGSTPAPSGMAGMTPPAGPMAGMTPPASPMAGMTPPAIPAGPMAGKTPPMDMTGMMSKMKGMMDEMMPMKPMAPAADMGGMKSMSGMTPNEPMKGMNSEKHRGMGMRKAKMEMMEKMMDKMMDKKPMAAEMDEMKSMDSMTPGTAPMKSMKAETPMGMGMEMGKNKMEMGKARMEMMAKMIGMMDKMGAEMDGMKSMDSMTPGAAPMKSMKSESPMGMGMEMGKAKMEMMSKMMGKGSTETSNGPVAQKALPGFPGASQLYHIGSTGFFLDQPTHITLSAEQQSALNQAKDQALLAKSTADQASAQAEQELWALTAADQPDALKIEAKMREIEKVKGDERLAFIRAVGDASKILTDEQRKVLAGLTPATTAMAPMKGM